LGGCRGRWSGSESIYDLLMVDRMDPKKTIARNTLFLLAATIFTNVAAFVWNVYLARYLGAAGFGVLSAALALTGIFSILADLGTGTYITREIARNPERAPELAGAGLGNRLILSFIVLILIFLFPLTGIYRGAAAAVVMFIAGYMLVSSFGSFFNSIFQGFQRMEYQTIWNILNSFFILVGVLCVVWLGGDVVSVAVAYLLAAIFSLLYSIIIFRRRFFTPRISSDLGMLRESLPFGITSVFALIYFWIDSVMLSFMKGEVSVGLYSAPYRLLTVITSLYSVYLFAVFPVMSRFYVESSESLKFTYRRSIKYLIMVAIPLIFLVFFLAPEIIRIIYSEEYLKSVPALRILILASGFMFINGVTSNLLGSADRQVTVTKITGLGALFNVAVNLLLIPAFSFMGASVATVLTELLMTILFLRVVMGMGYGPGLDDLKSAWRLAVPSLISVIILMIPADPLIRTVGFLIVYIVGIFIFRAVDDVDLQIMRSIIGK